MFMHVDVVLIDDVFFMVHFGLGKLSVLVRWRASCFGCLLLHDVFLVLVMIKACFGVNQTLLGCTYLFFVQCCLDLLDI